MPLCRALCAMMLLPPGPLAAAPVSDGHRLLREAAAQVLPERGHRSKVKLGDSVVKLVRTGVIDPEKFAALYASRGGVSGELADVLGKRSVAPILLTRQNAAFYVNVLWPLGLANRMHANRASPLSGEQLHSFASTGGWTLGSLPSGGYYFNRFSVVALSPSQEALVVEVARHSFRPCCDNSTYFQDCNHGSALLGLLALGAAQGLSEADLYREALAFNSFWFPDVYVPTAIYFEAVKGVPWRDVDARTVMSAAYSSASGWRANVVKELAARGILPRPDGTDCAA